MSTRRAYLVTGPEASGNRYLVDLLCRAGCFGGMATNAANETVQPVDGPGLTVYLPEPPPARLAFCRTLPHAGVWPNLSGTMSDLRRRGYRVTLLVPVRAPDMLLRSQVRGGHVSGEPAARQHCLTASRYLGEAIAAAAGDCLLVPYADLRHPGFVRWLLAELGLNPETPSGFIDGDAKYRQGERT